MCTNKTENDSMALYYLKTFIFTQYGLVTVLAEWKDLVLRDVVVDQLLIARANAFGSAQLEAHISATEAVAATTTVHETRPKVAVLGAATSQYFQLYAVVLASYLRCWNY